VRQREDKYWSPRNLKNHLWIFDFHSDFKFTNKFGFSWELPPVKLKKITSELLAIPISRDACVDHHRPPQPSNQHYRRLRWSKAANFTQWFEVAGATACLIYHRQVGPFDGGSIPPHFFISIAKLSSSWPTFAPQQTRSHPFDTATRFGVGGIGRTRIDVYCVENRERHVWARP
jgi:hypothetical protein